MFFVIRAYHIYYNLLYVGFILEEKHLTTKDTKGHKGLKLKPFLCEPLWLSPALHRTQCGASVVVKNDN